jgi:hypothetical protein
MAVLNQTLAGDSDTTTIGETAETAVDDARQSRIYRVVPDSGTGWPRLHPDVASEDLSRAFSE